MKKLIEQIVKFGIVGVLCFGIDFAIYTVLCTVFNVHYLIAGFFGFLISVTVNYLLSMKYIFIRRDNVEKKKEFTIFLILSVIGLLLNLLIIWVCVDGLYVHVTFINTLVSENFAKLSGKIVATAVVMVYNFVTRKIFLEKKESDVIEYGES